MRSVGPNSFEARCSCLSCDTQCTCTVYYAVIFTISVTESFASKSLFSFEIYQGLNLVFTREKNRFRQMDEQPAFVCNEHSFTIRHDPRRASPIVSFISLWERMYYSRSAL